jgi:hypothetical protein
MVPTAYHTFFGGCAGVAGTLIGLLFVAISVSPHKHVGSRAPLAFQVQAGVAFTTLINALVIALAALLPGNNLGTAAVILAGAGISSTIGMTVVSLRDRPGRHHLWGLAVIPVLGVLYILQLYSGINLLQRPGNPSPVHFEALLVIIFIIAIARAWQMIGARRTGMLAVVSDLLRERQHEDTMSFPPVSTRTWRPYVMAPRSTPSLDLVEDGSLRRRARARSRAQSRCKPRPRNHWSAAWIQP